MTTTNSLANSMVIVQRSPQIMWKTFRWFNLLNSITHSTPPTYSPHFLYGCVSSVSTIQDASGTNIVGFVTTMFRPRKQWNRRAHSYIISLGAGGRPSSQHPLPSFISCCSTGWDNSNGGWTNLRKGLTTITIEQVVHLFPAVNITSS